MGSSETQPLLSDPSTGHKLRPPPPPPGRAQEIIIGLVIVPLSFLVSCYEAVTGALERWRLARTAGSARARSEHSARVLRVAHDVQAWAAIPAAARAPLRTDRSSQASLSVRAADKTGAMRVRVGDFRHVLELDAAAGTVTIEPLVTVGELTTFLLSHGLMLEATLEMEDATLGGLALSQGMTTHSHRCGLVADTTVAYEMVTGEGVVLKASEEENEDVFRAMGFSHGSLGVLTALTLRVVPAERELVVTYRKYSTLEGLHKAYRDAAETTDAFFLEAIVFSPTHSVLIRGDPVHAREAAELRASGIPLNRQGLWFKKWFFYHAEEVEDGWKELMPMRDYLMRHDKSLCMTMKYVFPAGNNPLVRWLFGWMLPPKVTFLKGLRPPEVRLETAKSQVYQDLAVPQQHLVDLIGLVRKEVDVFPLLVYPCRVFDRGGYIRHPNHRSVPEAPDSGTLCFNLGVYGVPAGVRDQVPGFDTIAAVRRVLAWVRARGGFQHSYCDVFQTIGEFEDMFDHGLGNTVRKRVGSDGLPTVYEKVRPEVEWSV